MNRNFLMAVGIAAMDGLLCAFVAVLALAFLLQGEPVAAQSGAPVGMVAVELSWRSSTPGDARNNLILGIHAERPGCEKARYWPDSDGIFLTAAMGNPEACVIKAQWIRCTALQGQCTAWLLLQNVKPGSRFGATVYVAGTDQHEEPSAEQIVIQARTYSNAHARAKTLRKQRLTSGDLIGATIAVRIDERGVVRSDWVAVPPAATTTSSM